MNAIVKHSRDVALPRYEDMCRAIEECHRVDEAKDIRDRAEALRAYAKQANNRKAEVEFAECKVRAEVKCGELLQEMAATGQRATPKTANPSGTMQLGSEYFRCPVCQDIFDGEPVWHCTHCDHHWDQGREECHNCRQGKKLKSRTAKAIPFEEVPQHLRRNSAPTLADLGLTKDESSRFQESARAPRERVEEALKTGRETQTPVTSAQIRNLTKQPDFTPAQRADHERLWRVLRALEQISDQDIKPDDWVASLPDYMAARVANHLEKARPWLERLFQLWDKRQ